MHTRLAAKSLLALVLLTLWAPHAFADALTDAKRRAAADLFKQGKNADGIALLQEVVRIDPGEYQDHLQLARAYEKVNKVQEAVEAYHRAQDLLGTAATAAVDRAAKAEIDRRLKILEVQTQKVQAAEEEFLKKLDVLEREAIAAKDVRAVERIFRLKGGIYQATNRRDRCGLEVAAHQGWQESGLSVKQGATYLIRAVGSSTYKKGVTVSPDGSTQMSDNGIAPLGMLLARMDTKVGTYLRIGSSHRFTAEQTGKLSFLLSADSKELVGATGGAIVLIEQLQ